MTPTRERRQTASQGIRRKLQLQIGLGRTVILLMLVATLLNQLLLLMNVDFHFRLSASVPHYLNWLARELAGASGVTLLKLFAILVDTVNIQRITQRAHHREAIRGHIFDIFIRSRRTLCKLF